MENKPKENIYINLDQDGPVKEIRILHGDAAKPVEHEPVDITGDINAVKDFIESQLETIEVKRAIILFNEASKKIEFTNFPGWPLRVNVSAKLEEFPELNSFGINKDKFFGLKEIEKFVRMNRFWFADKEAHMKLANDLKVFSAKVQSELQHEADQRGNKNQVFKKQVTSDLAADFVLFIPLFKGSAASNFRVEICYDVTDSQVRFWLESVELFELQKQAVYVAFEPQKQQFKELGFTVINQ